jgi:hypothetical protein
LQELVRTGRVKPTRVVGRGMKISLFSEEDADSLGLHRPIGYQYGQALPTGIQMRRMKYLHASGLISSNTDHLGRSWLDGEELRALLGGLARRALPLPERHGPVTSLASQWIWQRRHVPAIGAVLQRLLLGELPLWSSGQAPGFDRYLVGSDFLAELAWRSRVVSTREAGPPTQLDLAFDDARSFLSCPGVLSSRLHSLRGPNAPRQVATQLTLSF